MAYTIYLRTNLVNGKQYVGQTKDLKTREKAWNSLKLKYANKILTEDREKYGLDAWTVKVLAECDNREDAWELEKRFINDFNTLWPNGYNMGNGGKSNYDVNKGKKNGMYGKTPWNKGVAASEELIEKNRQSHLGLMYPTHRKKVIQIKDDGTILEWNTTYEPAIDGYSQGHVSSCCNGNYNRIGNHHYKDSSFYFKEDYDKMQ